MANVKILSCTPYPLQAISIAAGTCYGKTDISEKRVENCIKAGHESVLEHASATFQISDISRACSHQLVRHRLASYSQQSQRYCKIDTGSNDWYVIPPDILADEKRLELYQMFMGDYAWYYNAALNDGVKPEDARYLLPEACKTEIVVTMNCREFFHFLETRLSHRAQWEIRQLAQEMCDTLAEENKEWRKLIDMWIMRNFNNKVENGV